jgi:hypothetical protein
VKTLTRLMFLFVGALSPVLAASTDPKLDATRQVCEAAYDQLYTPNIGNPQLDKTAWQTPVAIKQQCAAEALSASQRAPVPGNLAATYISGEKDYRDMAASVVLKVCVMDTVIAGDLTGGSHHITKSDLVGQVCTRFYKRAPG